MSFADGKLPSSLPVLRILQAIVGPSVLQAMCVFLEPRVADYLGTEACYCGWGLCYTALGCVSRCIGQLATNAAGRCVGQLVALDLLGFGGGVLNSAGLVAV